MVEGTKEIAPVIYSAAAVKTLHYKVKPNSCCINLHWHDRIEILRIKKGELVVECYKNTIKLKAGEMIFITPGMSHKGYTMDNEVEYDVLMFDLKMFYNQTSVCNHYFSMLSDGSAKFENIISDAETLSCTDQICNSEDLVSLEIISLVYKLIYLLFKNHLYKISPENKVKIKHIIDYIEEHYMLDINTATLSKKFCYSSEHFCRKFKEATGITPMTYLRVYRLEQALKLIKTNDYSIGEIACMCGFYDANYFSRCFKAHYGVPPRYYRKNTLND